ncbi:putative multidrug resistance-associated protein lethal(2)03659-like Protein [Tribolium castaneum]|uniref:Putative multidrug resistance-associated protein lethal(2)03659-like Protein n=1 Tax=Tribolium castaneum TaxID=7070 RepID=D6WJN5_TRICA|nr:putative multidrug resistance-associated protein lethal(2)03659-like Protein [Tribolium castaneum]
MDAGYTLTLENPKRTANIISKLFFLWMVKLCYKGTKKGLEIADLYKTLSCDQSEKLTDELEKHWNEEVEKNKLKLQKPPSLTRAIVKTFLWKYMGFGILLFVQNIVFRAFQPVILAYFINLFSGEGQDNQNEMYIFGSVLVIQTFFIVITMHHIDLGQASIGMRIRVAVSSLIYRKMLKLNKRSLGSASAGQVVNLLSNDVNRFDFITLALHYLWIMPFQVVLVTYLIWREMGVSTLAGVLSMLCLTLPVQGYLGKLTSKLRLKTAQRTDYRVKLMNEIISGIQIIKMYAWEKPFEQIVKQARKHEIDVVTQASYLRGIYLSCMVFIERTTLFLTITCYVLLGNPITADKVFSIAQFYNILQLALAICYPMAITFGAETLVSIKRLCDFLVLEEKPQSQIERKAEQDIEFDNTSGAWNSDSLTLQNLDLFIPQGTLCAIVGPVGAGKSSILQMLLGELPPITGSIKVGGKISYASQEPWLFAATVRNNILFGREYDRALYREVVKVCALERDFKQFPQGDRTVVGERGVSLSGGQRARINLARAVYRGGDVYLLDDPLSAVDTHVGRHLFDECIVKYLRGKTRVLITHQLQYLKKADHIVVLNEGRIEAQGKFQELINSDLDFTKLLASQDETEKEETAKAPRKSSVVSHKSNVSESSEFFEPSDDMEDLDYSNSSPFKDYIKASGNKCAVFGLLLVLLLGQSACSAADYWVTFWTQQEAYRYLNSTQIIQKSENYSQLTDDILIDNQEVYLIKTEVAMYIYGGIIAFAIFFTLVRSFAFFKMAMTASKNLHGKMFHALLQAPMRFFDTNPSGRVLNRFSKDMGAIDEFLPRVLVEAIQILLVMSGILVMVTIANYYMVVAMVIIGLLFLKVRSWYVATAKDVKHLEGITKSNVYSHLNSSFSGITTIRAAEAEVMLAKEFDKHQDNHTSAWFLTIATRVCFGLWLDLLSIVFIFCVIFSFIVLNQFTQVSGSLVGLAISQSLILTGMLQFGMRQTAEVVNQLTSVERVMQYTKLDSEFTETKKTVSFPWPSKGMIEFQNLSLKYSEFDPPVLRHLNLTIAPGAKIGIVGRTGAGKSSLISALFRLAPIEGKILIDGIDTKTIDLNRLRKKISIIPQAPVLFSATLRYNLDPFQEFDDTKLWDVLEQVELKESIRHLDVPVSEGGSNFSLGQRQLLCLARAILRNNQILVLDEATANVDPRWTDALIQQTIRQKFHNCTVLTIAHRLNTIMDSDRVLVMDSGKVAEFDHPHLLLQDEDGHFAKMVAETGPAMTQQLKQIAHDCTISKLFFLWIIPLYRKIIKNGLQICDLCKILESDESEKVSDKLENNWNKELLRAKLKNGQPSLLKAIGATFFWKYMSFGAVLFIQHVFLRSFQPIVLSYLISLFGQTDPNHTAMYVSSGILVTLSLLIVLSMHQVNFGHASIGMRIRIAISALVYRKTLRLNRRSLNQTSIGQIVNLLSNDVTRFDLVVLTLHYLWILPFQVSIITFLCWSQVGISSLVGVVSIALLSLPVQGYLGKLTSNYRVKVAQKTDHRVTLMNEIVSGIQVIKMYGWEKPFEHIVRLARSQEVKALTITSYLRGIYLSAMIFVERTALFLTLSCYVFNGNTILAQHVFSISQFFNLLQLTMSIFYPLSISYGAEALVSIDRIQAFLQMEEVEPSKIETDFNHGVTLSNVNSQLLKNITFKIPQGTLCAIVGPVGSGKTSLLHLLLNESSSKCGKITLQGSISYAAQEPWLFASTIRKNILFGNKYDRHTYNKVVKVCALKKDFDQFPLSDKTLVGERGSALSGGQRARVNLARAVYKDSDIYLLDDPLSAVDAHVGNHLFEQCILKYLKGKTRILVTHQLQFLKRVDHIIVLKNGQIEAQGTYAELSHSKLDFPTGKRDEEVAKPDSDLHTLSDSFMLESTNYKNEVEDIESTGMSEGATSLIEYVMASGTLCQIFLVSLALLVCQTLCSGTDFWVTFWTQQEALRNITINETLTVPVTQTIDVFPHNDSLTDSYSYTYNDEKQIVKEVTVSKALIETRTALYVYLALIVVLIIVTFLRSILYFTLAMKASRNLHNNMFTTLLQAQMKFFNSNPSGRILNRFSKDMGAIDEILPKVLLEAIQITLTMCGILVMVIISNQYMIPVVILLGVVFSKIRSWFVTTTKNIKHLEGITKSPVFSHMNSSLYGITTIRACGAEEMLKKEFDRHQDVHTSSWFLLITTTSSFGLWLDLVCVAFIGFTSFSFILLNHYYQISGSLVGLAISQSLILTGMLQYGVRQSAEVVNQLTSVERILQYSEIEKEGPFNTSPEHRPPPFWPDKGQIELRDMSLHYSPAKPPVLKNITVKIAPGQKIGIVGRTGAGKSSLIAALFRLSDISGTIYIDGVDTKKLGVHDLRKKISIIPQVPVLFSSTVRYNLDPFGDFEDGKLWDVLDEVELKDSVVSLDAEVARDGGNFSVGQRQLICLARAILKNNKILVMDEATANTDDKTDALIQKMIRKRFKSCTVITVAHRLHTVMDSDRIIVMDDGRVVEFDHPYNLLQRPDTTFYKMVLETGLETSVYLEDMALDAFLNKQSIPSAKEQ